MADFSSIMTSPEHLAVEGGSVGRATSSSVMSGNGNWDGAGGMDQITVVRIDDTHIEDQSHVGEKFKDGDAQFYEVVDYSMPSQEEEEVVAEEEEDSIFVIEYSNPEEEGESYQFTMSVDRSVPVTKPVTKPPAVRENTRAPLPVMTKLPKPRHEARQKRKQPREEEEKKEEVVMSNKSILELGENYSNIMEMNTGKRLICSLCPPPGRLFKRGSGLAVHLKQMHHLVEKKTFFCTSCQQAVRTQIELDTHTKRHAHQDAVFTCLLCSAEKKTGFRGSRLGLKTHLEKEHPGVVPRCDICNKGFKSLMSYLADQFRHVGKSPYYCTKCQIYEMTERGLSVHIRNHDKKKKKEEEESEPHLLTSGVSVNIDNSATDDSDF